MADIKKLGEMMQEDHSRSMQSLIVLAKSKSVTVPTSLDSSARTDYKYLNSQPGRNFEKEYCGMMVKGHGEAIAVFEKDCAESNDVDIRQWKISTLPTLHRYLALSVVCQERLQKIQ